MCMPRPLLLALLLLGVCRGEQAVHKEDMIVEDEATCLWEDVMATQHAHEHQVQLKDNLAPTEHSAPPKQKKTLTSDLVIGALRNLASRSPQPDQPPSAWTKRPLLRGPPQVKTAEERQAKIDGLRKLRTELLQDRQLRDAVRERRLVREGGTPVL